MVFKSRWINKLKKDVPVFVKLEHLDHILAKQKKSTASAMPTLLIQISISVAVRTKTRDAPDRRYHQYL